MHNFRKLNIWIEARVLVKEVYLLTAQFPLDEKFGLISQINRCAISVPSNIAERSARSTNKDFAHFLRIRLGSLYELETQLILSSDLKIVARDKVENTIQKAIVLQKIITNFIKTLV